MNRIAFLHADLIMPDRIVKDAALVVEDGKIAAIGEPVDAGCFEGRIVDAAGLYLSPGFIDIHTHGGGGCDFMDGTADAFITACETHARYGTTALQTTNCSIRLTFIIRHGGAPMPVPRCWGFIWKGLIFRGNTAAHRMSAT